MDAALTSNDVQGIPVIKTEPASMHVDGDQVSGSSSEDEGGDGDSGDTGESGVESSDGDECDRQNEEEDWSEESDSSVASSEANEPEPEEEQLQFPAALPATSVQLMAQSVGVTLPGYVASALGQLAMNKLRHVVMIANQLRKHDQSKGLGVDHFSTAEKMLGSSSFGHKSSYAVPKFKNIGKRMVIMQDSTQIDLSGTIVHAQQNPEPLHPVASVSLTNHHLNAGSLSSRKQSGFPNTHANEAGIAPDFHSHLHTKSDSTNSEPPSRINVEILQSSNSQSKVKVTEKLEHLMEKILVLNEVQESETFSSNEVDPKTTSNTVIVGIEWIDYMKVFMISFFSRQLETTDLSQPIPVQSDRPKCKTRNNITSKDFKLIIDDVTSNGVTPVLNILLDFFEDYMQGRFGKHDCEGLRRILSLLVATLTCPIRIDEVYLQKIHKTLITLISLIPPTELHQNIAHTFILLMKKASDDFSTDVKVWICNYITETITWCLNSCVHKLEDKIALFNMGVSLAIALEEFGVHLSLDLGWHSLIMEFAQGLHNCQTNSSIYRPSTNGGETMGLGGGPLRGFKYLLADCIGQIHDAVMVFLCLFFKNYAEKASSETINQIHSFAVEVFGEKLVSYLAESASFESFKKRKTGTNPVVRIRKRYISPNRLRSVPWKSKRIAIGRMPKKF